MITTPPIVTFTENALLMATGVVLNVKVVPFVLVVAVIDDDAVDAMMKSVANPVDGPDPSRTVIVQLMAELYRSGFGTVHANDDAVVG